MQAICDYLAYQGVHYIKPEKAGPLAGEMAELRSLAQSARKEFQELSQLLTAQVAPFQSEGVSQWMNQAQICRPHFWSYFRLPSDGLSSPTFAIRLYGQGEEAGISVEVSFVERKKLDSSLIEQNRVLQVPIQPPVYYRVQEGDSFTDLAGDENNRQTLLEQVTSGQVRKVLVKLNFPLLEDMEEMSSQLAHGFTQLQPYFQATKISD